MHLPTTTSLLALGALCSTLAVAPAGEGPEPPPREFRGVWVATVANLDWPSRPGLSAGEQKREAIAILDECVRLNLNAVIWQARPAGDALYDSGKEPWSHYLTGRQGEAPGYDPLAFWVGEAHQRGLELHAWFNPYRVRHSGASDITLADSHIANHRPEWVVELADGHLWLLPTEGGVEDHTIDVIMDVVRRYDIDGVHFDDYFYPYASSLGGRSFPDDKSWRRYREDGGTLARGDWRRGAVNSLVERLYREVKAERPSVRVGISPFGIWQPGHPPGITGLNPFEVLHADSRHWLREGWLDYMTPQLYWPIHQTAQSFPVLLRWWREQNIHGRHLWPGLGTFWITSNPPRHRKTPNDVVAEIMVTRGIVAENTGHVHFRMQWFLNHPELGEALLEGPYRERALVPASPWLGRTPHPPPDVRINRRGDHLQFSWGPAGGAPPFLWVVYTERGGRWSHEILPGTARSHTTAPAARAAVTAIDRLGNESGLVVHDLELPP